PAGSRFAYASARGGNLEAWLAPLDQSAEPRQLTHLGGEGHVDSWSRAAATLALHHHAPGTRVNIMMLAPDGAADAKPRLFLQGDPAAEGAFLSPDGRYAVYQSRENGPWEVYVRPYPGPGGRQMVSVSGGREALWAANGEVFYRSGNGDRMFAVRVETTPVLKIGTPTRLFEGLFYVASTGSPRPQYDVSADGQRFLMLSPGPGANPSAARPRIVVVENWFEELKGRVPVDVAR